MYSDGLMTPLLESVFVCVVCLCEWLCDITVCVGVCGECVYVSARLCVCLRTEQSSWSFRDVDSSLSKNSQLLYGSLPTLI